MPLCRSTFSTLLLFLVYFATQAQTRQADTAYYVTPEYRLPWVKTLSLVSPNWEAQSMAHWYVGLSGFAGNDQSRQTGNLNSLVTAVPVWKTGWDVLVGYVSRGWAGEGGYVRSPTNLKLTVPNNYPTLDFSYQTSQHAIFGRLKRRLIRTNRAVGAGIWVSGGARLTSNTSFRETVLLRGITYARQRQVVDTIQINIATQTVRPVSGQVELGIDYAAPIGKRLMLDVFVRRYWGIGQALESTMVYQSSRGNSQTAAVTANGEGWSLGFGLYYRYATRHQLTQR
ncbi:hypothetical protein [Spirosoma sp. KUDC1026]|uniref:hypothetical protein n=1 Tax=Spirosoma sp. KUDC1026 TaxID=2745947 RepID=UPI00159BAF6D|nr:hypothetical protein [Spirosoma sp. KUDC1026]QKZ12941.1 hypothetical protein HU175_09980 [Spirosoma sp. KUDC1026]